MKRSAPWLAVIVLTAALSALTAGEALRRYRAFETGWSWDLAYYNQWLWAITYGDGVISIRPGAAYATEGPSVWKMNYLSPLRFALIPIYRAFPDPRTLLVVHAVMFWWIVPAAFTFTRAETKSDGLALLAAALVPATPLLWPLAFNDFRELQLAPPFVLWAIQGYRSRNLRLAAFGVAGMLACRQEFALVLATFGLIPPREREDIGRTHAWAQWSMVLGLAWMLFGFFGYLKWVVGPGSPGAYINQFGGPKAPILAAMTTSADLLGWGMGPWALLALLAPRVALIAVPWVWSITNGRWALWLLAGEEWHHVRYAAPLVPLVLAAGLIGYARVAGWLLRRPRGRLGVAALAGIMGAGLLTCDREVFARLDGAPRKVRPDEAEAIWHWIDQVGPDDAVLTGYETSAPLSTRSTVYSYRLEWNKPKGYPTLPPDVRWAFIEHNVLQPETLTEQGFQEVHLGPFLRIFRRDGPAEAGGPGGTGKNF